MEHLLACDDKAMLVRELPAGTKVAHKTGAVSNSRCDGWIIVDAAEGRTVAGHEVAMPLPFASTTKIMTAWLVVRLAACRNRITTCGLDRSNLLHSMVRSFAFVLRTVMFDCGSNPIF